MNGADEPKAVVERCGRWAYRIYISRGLMQYGPGGYGWFRFGRERAARKAGRELRRYIHREALRADTFVVTK